MKEKNNIKLYKIEIPIDIKNYNIDNILYASAFINKNIINTNYLNGKIIFKLNKKLSKIKIEKDLNILKKRFPKIIHKENIFFEKKYLKNKLNFLKTSKQKDMYVKIGRGLYVFKKEFSQLIKFLDFFVYSYYGKYFKSVEEIYPNMIKLDSLKKANHLSSFPEHLLFNFHLDEDLKNLHKFSKKNIINKFNQIGEIKYVQNPSTCFHCYAIRENKNIQSNIAISAITKCNRYESSNNNKFERLLEFYLREVIFLGSNNYIAKTRKQTLDLTKKLSNRWNIAGKIVSSNDPFFTNDYKSKSFFQLKLNLKYEFKCDLPFLNRKVSIMSSNVHGDTFSKNFKIKCKNKYIQTGCLGFGLERFAMVIIAQHGTDKKKWPRKLKEDFQKWSINENQDFI